LAVLDCTASASGPLRAQGQELSVTLKEQGHLRPRLWPPETECPTGITWSPAAVQVSGRVSKTMKAFLLALC